MNKNILFLQLEIIPNCPPHMGICLFIDDLKRIGINCDTYIVNANYLHVLPDLIEKGNYSLIGLDSVFTIDIIKPLQTTFPHIPIIVGGVNSLPLLLHTDLQYAVFGPGRSAIRNFIQEHFGTKNYHAVPNLFFKKGKDIQYSGITQDWNIESELFPYVPFLDWKYIGQNRDSKANYNDVSIVAGTGCPYSNSMLSSTHFPINEVLNGLGYTLSDAAFKRLDEIYNRKRHGCSFCIFQYQEFTCYTIEKTIDLLLKQASYLYSTHKVTSFQIQTENPLPFLYRFILALFENGIGLQKISFRTRTDLLLSHQSDLLKCLELARERDFLISVEQIGFESFFDTDLKLFKKNVNKAKNIETLMFLKDIKCTYCNHVSANIGHGIILFHPWTTIESITENLRVISENTDIFPQLFLGSLVVYSEFLPIYPKMSREGLVEKSEYGYGFDFKIQDPLANKAYELYKILHLHFGGDISAQNYLRSLEFIEKYSIDEILQKYFNLVPISDK